MSLLSGLFRVMEFFKKREEEGMNVEMDVRPPTLERSEMVEDEIVAPRLRRFSDTMDYVPNAGPSYAHPYTRKNDGPDPEPKPEPEPAITPVPQFTHRRRWKLDAPSPKFDGEL